VDILGPVGMSEEYQHTGEHAHSFDHVIGAQEKRLRHAAHLRVTVIGASFNPCEPLELFPPKR
jgi:hypothetical protein